MEKHFQIRYVDRHGCGSFEYFKATEDFEKKAEEFANAYLKKRYEADDQVRLSNSLGGFNLFHRFYKPHKTLSVVEYDNVKHCRKRGGIKFKLKLAFIKTVYKGGGSHKQEWYEAV